MGLWRWLYESEFDLRVERRLAHMVGWRACSAPGVVAAMRFRFGQRWWRWVR